ncbi:MAG TPA: flagellar biosynthesis anti-sigma factor FlgM [Bryobacteraceae bacterium]|nr:flagellar biosynthesis anti-sigma factor FlgM [Bryobacteraceae bacterium]HOL69958.1 flagellar biosynthesis anti-sigma factor FlgM [Bryobacteraceae bacterium]HOQ44205.1 flagellar biosynthesis anti-sigma factor FlgM [Bryobacteraceae bacterium]HPQ17539.1 flagellar biosynthesis anti-sigma factor FlgM [Bryobacteraceae bacterium]HPU70523.1 flagellar biosynthesis anti-sigma factor FlgM [Bryobacteraceae bacterium]
MRIGDLNTAPVNPAGSPAIDKHKGHETPAESKDAVELSRLSRAVMAQGASEARLEELRAQFKAGTYQPPAEEVSRSILRFYEK